VAIRPLALWWGQVCRSNRARLGPVAVRDDSWTRLMDRDVRFSEARHRGWPEASALTNSTFLHRGATGGTLREPGGSTPCGCLMRVGDSVIS